MKHNNRCLLIGVISFIIAIFLLACIYTINAQESVTPVNVITPNQASFSWNPVIEPVIDHDVGIELKYEVFLSPGGIKNGQNRQDPSLYTSLGVTGATAYTVTFTEQNVYLVGVRTLKYIGGNDTPLISDISWCDDPSRAADPWVWLYFDAPSGPFGLSL